MHHNRNKLCAVPLRCCRKTVHGLAGEARFQACCALVEAHQLICVHQLRLAVSQTVHPDGGVFLDLLVENQRPGHQGNVIGGGQVSVVVCKPRAVHKAGVYHPQLLGALVHPGHKALL